MKHLLLSALVIISLNSFSQTKPFGVIKVGSISSKSLGTSIGGGASVGIAIKNGPIIGAGISTNSFQKLKKLYTPVFIEFSAFPEKNEVFPILSAKGGYGFIDNSNTSDAEILINKGGPYGSIAAGVSLPINNGKAVHLTVGYDLMEMQVIGIKRTFKGVSFSAGFKF